jgi:hypothetical protein
LSPYHNGEEVLSVEALDEAEEASLEQPTEIRDDVWMRFLMRRRTQVQKERNVEKLEKDRAQKENQLQFLQRLVREFETQIGEWNGRKQELKQGGLKLSLDGAVLVNMKQGEVELEEEPVVNDLKHCEMMDRSYVEQLNQRVIDKALFNVRQLEKIKKKKKRDAHARVGVGQGKTGVYIKTGNDYRTACAARHQRFAKSH